MLAKVPKKRADGRSSFSTLISYLIERPRESVMPVSDHLKENSDHGLPIQRITKVTRRPPPPLRSRLHTLSERNLVPTPQPGEVLLPENVPCDLGRAATEHTRLRRYDGDGVEVSLSPVSKVISAGGVVCYHNCLSLETAAKEMHAVAMQNQRVKDPLYHLIISWQTDEDPTDSQIFESAIHTLNHLGMADHQYLFAIHRDTDNVHVHLTVNKVHPETYKSASTRHDYAKLSYAMRELEVRFGFKKDRGTYDAVLLPNGEVQIVQSNDQTSSNSRPPSKAAEMEVHTDQESLYSYARGEPRKALVASLKNPALTWMQLHNVLGKYGLAIRPRGQGFAIHDMRDSATTPIKASSMHEDLSKTRLLRRMGEFIESEVTVSPVSQYDKLLPLRDPKRRENQRLIRAEKRRKLRERYKIYRQNYPVKKIDVREVRRRYQQIRSMIREQRQNIMKTVADPIERKALYSIIAYEALLAKDRLRREIAAERATLKADPTNKPLDYREWVTEEAKQGDQAAISQLRGYHYNDKRQQRTESLSAKILNDVITDPHYVQLPDFTVFVNENGSIRYTGKNGIGFVDHGKHILLSDAYDDAVLIAALRFGAVKYDGQFQLTGATDFQQRALRILASEQLKVTLKDREQQALLDKYRDELRSHQRRPDYR